MKVHPGRVITFYSYKGGVGRTQTLVSCACALSAWGWRVLVVDFDLEAPGVDRYLRRWAPELRQGPGLVDLILDPALDWRAAVVPVTVMSRPDARGESKPVAQALGAIEVLHAGSTDGGRYAERLHRIDWKELFPAGLMERVEAWRRDWQEAYDFILIDSRTGLSDSAGVSTVQLPEILVALFTPNEQSLDGVLEVARSAQRLQAALPLSRARMRVVPVPTRLDASEHRLQEAWVERIAEQTRPWVEEWAEIEGFSRDDMFRYLQAVGTPYVPFWSYGEGVPWVDESAGTRFSVRVSHKSLARMLAVGLEVAAAWEAPDPRESVLRYIHPAGRWSWSQRPRTFGPLRPGANVKEIERTLMEVNQQAQQEGPPELWMSHETVVGTLALAFDPQLNPAEQRAWRDFVETNLMEGPVAPDTLLGTIGYWRAPDTPEFYRDLAQRVARRLLSDDDLALWNAWFDEQVARGG
jgi:Mrp family chromosome partitioning ATPase